MDREVFVVTGAWKREDLSVAGPSRIVREGGDGLWWTDRVTTKSYRGGKLYQSPDGQKDMDFRGFEGSLVVTVVEKRKRWRSSFGAQIALAAQLALLHLKS